MEIAAIVEEFIAHQRLPASFRRQAQQWLIPLARDYVPRVEGGGLHVLGISGSQGSGKSTIAAFLRAILSEHFGYRVVDLSLDDFYFTRAEREELAARIHPLLRTRGVPGSHDIALAGDTITALITGTKTVALPRFDKARDDRAPPLQWPSITAPVDLVILEGWCLGIPPQSEAQLARPVNALEREEDRAGSWRRYANQALAESYPTLFALIDHLIFLRAPDFNIVRAWRGVQEEKLIQLRARERDNRIMDRPALNRFLQHYERLTRHGLATLGAIADTEFILDEQQTIVARKDPSHVTQRAD